MKTITKREYNRLYELADDGDLNAREEINYPHGIIYQEIFDHGMSDDEELTFGIAIDPYDSQNIIEGWLPPDMVEECRIEIELTPTNRYCGWTSDITRQILSQKYYSVRELKRAIKEFYLDYKDSPYVHFNPKNIYYEFKYNLNDEREYFIYDTGIKLTSQLL
ncbi:hypothetical protein [Leptospira bouyouniensis]|uniref:Uncharacterized protein n=1 Tax=Leptospira bouyouniensis TaxID=2484911 RepID=A0ABY2KZ94_9LEPT|nr:hypothetical protein [Leptospira bouyouniensis]TGK45918.1 hypothetical protein EHQ10_18615 [Leptospira bouyouniensis]